MANEIVTDGEISKALSDWNWTVEPSEGRLMLAELLIKSGAGYKSSYTEEGFMREFNLLKKDGTPNRRGFRFLCSVIYQHSNLRSDFYHLSEKYRQ